MSAVRIAEDEYQGYLPGVARGAARHASMASEVVGAVNERATWDSPTVSPRLTDATRPSSRSGRCGAGWPTCRASRSLSQLGPLVQMIAPNLSHG